MKKLITLVLLLFVTTLIFAQVRIGYHVCIYTTEKVYCKKSENLDNALSIVKLRQPECSVNFNYEIQGTRIVRFDKERVQIYVETKLIEKNRKGKDVYKRIKDKKWKKIRPMTLSNNGIQKVGTRDL